jgi:hypothetical protein
MIALVTAAVILSGGSVQAQDTPPNLTGTWRFTVNTGAGSGTPTVTLKQQGDTLTGSYSSQIFGEQQIKGTVKGREFNFSFNANIQGTALTVTYTGTIATADSLNGQVNLGEAGNGTFTAKRQPPAEDARSDVKPARIREQFFSKDVFAIRPTQNHKKTPLRTFI